MPPATVSVVSWYTEFDPVDAALLIYIENHVRVFNGLSDLSLEPAPALPRDTYVNESLVACGSLLLRPSRVDEGP